MYFYSGGKLGQIETIRLAGLVLKGEGDPRYPQNKNDIMYVDCEKVKKVAKANMVILQNWNLYMGK